MEIKNSRDLRQAIRQGPYAWPGGYPVYFVTSDGGVLAHSTVKAEFLNIVSAVRDRRNDGWRVVAADINWEDTNLVDDHTGELIESAYGDDTDTNEQGDG